LILVCTSFWFFPEKFITALAKCVERCEEHLTVPAWNVETRGYAQDEFSGFSGMG
jgi:hypothetical protein